MAGKGNTRQSSYFEHGNFTVYAVIAVGLFLLFVSWLTPDSIFVIFLKPLEILVTKFGFNWSTVVQVLAILTIIAHACESAYAVHLSRRNNLDIMSTMKWAFFTTFFGMGILYLLIKYDAKQRKSNKPVKDQQKSKAKKR